VLNFFREIFSDIIEESFYVKVGKIRLIITSVYCSDCLALAAG
jgi:hypothetical protein